MKTSGELLLQVMMMCGQLVVMMTASKLTDAHNEAMEAGQLPAVICV